MHPHVHRRAGRAERPPIPAVLPTRPLQPPVLASFAARNIRGEVVREFQEAARQRK